MKLQLKLGAQVDDKVGDQLLARVVGGGVTFTKLELISTQLQLKLKFELSLAIFRFVYLNIITFFHVQEEEAKDVDIDLDEVLDIEDEMERKLFVMVGIEIAKRNW